MPEASATTIKDVGAIVAIETTAKQLAECNISIAQQSHDASSDLLVVEKVPARIVGIEEASTSRGTTRAPPPRETPRQILERIAKMMKTRKSNKVVPVLQTATPYCFGERLRMVGEHATFNEFNVNNLKTIVRGVIIGEIFFEMIYIFYEHCNQI